MPWSLILLLVLAVLVWLAGLAGCVGAFHWSCRADIRRPRAALLLAVMAFVVGYMAWGHLQLSYSQTTNGRGWTIDSRWFFLALCGLAIGCGLLAGWALWRERRAGHPTT